MNSTCKDLLKAIQLVETVEMPGVNQDPWRLGYHLMPPVGWLNDPNGLCYFKGYYHVFFQYAPFDAKGGIKVWGHYKSKDLVQWEYLGTPLVTDAAEDSHGVYSGSALVEGDTVSLFYTGNVKRLGEGYDYNYSGREANTLLVETKDMVHFSPKVCVMTNEDYGDDLSCHVRDPKVWKEGTMYYMVQGARTKDDQGVILVFASSDKKKWEVINRLTTQECFGYMWECPDLFTLGEKTILMLSPQGVAPEGYLYQNQYQTGYYVLEGDFKGAYTLGEFVELDRGFDFYAPQSFVDEKGRRILIGWMGVPDCESEYTNPTVQRGWQHCLTLPRELRLEANRVMQVPLIELEALREKETIQRIEQEGIIRIGSSAEFILTAIEIAEEIKIIINNAIELHYNKEERVFYLRFLDACGAGRKERAVALEVLHEVRVFIDYSAIEVYINGGEEVFSSRYYPTEVAEDITLHVLCESTTVTCWDLKPMTYHSLREEEGCKNN